MLDKFGFELRFKNYVVEIFKDNVSIGFCYFIDRLYKFDLDSDYENSLMTMNMIFGSKSCAINKNSSKLWHKRLCHIFIQRIKRLVNDGVLKTLDFTDVDTCVGCIKGK